MMSSLGIHATKAIIITREKGMKLQGTGNKDFFFIVSIRQSISGLLFNLTLPHLHYISTLSTVPAIILWVTHLSEIILP